MHGGFPRLVLAHLLAQRGDLVLQPRRLGFSHLAFLTVRRLQRRQIALDARLGLLDAALNRAARERPVAGVDRLEPAAVDRHHRVGEEVQASTQATNCRQAERIARPLSLRKSAIVLKSGASLPVSHIISTLRAVSRSKRRLDWTWLT